LQENDLPLTFFRQEVVDLAQKLIGKIFVRKTDKGIIKAIIV
jgi:3-methyladenine DNA glycosylase Mpg